MKDENIKERHILIKCARVLRILTNRTRSVSVVILPVLIVIAILQPSNMRSVSAAGVTLLGPTPYVCQSDSPFAASISAGTTVQEDFEDGALNTPGVTASSGSVIDEVINHRVDSVDCDAGPVDGSGSTGSSFNLNPGSPGITFTFNSLSPGGILPTQAGVVWTDGEGDTTFEAFDENGISLGTTTATIADGSTTGTTAEDRFFGVINVSGISAIKISNSMGGIEVDHLQYGQPFTSSPTSEGQIVFFSVRDGDHEVYTMDPDGSNQTNISNYPASGDLFPAFSPDGSKIVFQSRRDDPGNLIDEIYLMNSDGTDVQRLTNNPAYDLWPKFSPDGAKIVFCSNRDGEYDIYLMNIDGSGLQQLTNTNDSDLQPEFSPDGSRIVFSRDNDIFVMNADGSDVVPLTTGGDSEPTFSPDGTKIVFRSGSELHQMNSDGSGRVVLSAGFDHDQPAFSPDGSKIAFRFGTAIWLMAPDGSSRTQLTAGDSDHYPSWGPDWTSAPAIAVQTVSVTVGYTTNQLIASVSDGQDAADELMVEVNGPTLVNGIVISTISVDAFGNVTADIAAEPDAADAMFPLRVTNSVGAFRDAVLRITVTSPADDTPPAIVPQISGTLGNNGWYVSDVAVSWTVTDPDSPLGTLTGCDEQVVNVDTPVLTVTCIAESDGGTATESVTIKRDATQPIISLDFRTAPNGLGWNKTSVVITWNCVDITSGPVQSIVTQSVLTEGLNQSSAADCLDNAGNTASDTQTGINVDKTPPTLNPSVVPNPVLFGSSATATAGAADTLSGIESQGCGATDTSTVGAKSITCSATDRAGNSATAEAGYIVNYRFAGFFQPVDNLPVLNEVKAGSSIPIKFSLYGNHGLNILAPGYPASGQTVCTTSTPGDLIEETAAAGASELSYDPTSDRYTYVWKSSKGWKGTCRLLVVKLKDGSTYVASFRFK